MSRGGRFARPLLGPQGNPAQSLNPVNSVQTNLIVALVFVSASAVAQLGPGGATASFKGSLPPKPTADLSADQQGGIEKKLAEVTAAFQAVKKHEHAADADIFLKAVRYAIDFHEWYDKKPEDGVKKANALLDEAAKRIDALKQNKTPWMEGTGQKVLGFYSKIDGSAQPYGVEIPDGLVFGKNKPAVPMWIWLHGRGDTATDLPFVYSRLMAKKAGQFQPADTIVIHPFGRYCNGWKSAGEVDVFESSWDAQQRFHVDENRIALAGFSMGGAGAWHMGAHFADRWACVHTGAGFADVKRYTKLTPDKYPNWYEQTLWGLYDVPDYARNFFNVPLISYSGEVDSQRDSAEYMMEVLGKEGLHPPHLIGPGMPHKYHPETIKEVQKWIEAAVAKGRDVAPPKVTMQFRSARYASMEWIRVIESEKPWENTRVDAEVTDAGIQLTTKNVAIVQINFDIIGRKNRPITINGQKIDKLPDNVSSSGDMNTLVKGFGGWQLESDRRYLGDSVDSLKAGGTCMEDALMKPFTVVLPDGKGRSEKVDAWVQVESQHFIQRWRGLMRGDPVVVKASEIDMSKNSDRNLVLWGDDKSNSAIAWLLKSLPLKWDGDKVSLGGQSFDAATHVPLLGFPRRPEFHRSGDALVLINSGLTFREAHDKTNSLQNPKLPDWAILDVTQPPTSEAAGKVVAADFFDSRWKVVPRVKDPNAKE